MTSNRVMRLPSSKRGEHRVADRGDLGRRPTVDRRRVVPQPRPHPVRRTGGVGAGRAHVLGLALEVADLDRDQAARVEARGRSG